MLARSILAALTALLLAAAMLAGGSDGTRAAETKTAIFAGGCFWCVEEAFDKVDGVTETVSGYAGGTKPDPTYGSHEGYVEAVKVTYDPAKVTYAKLVDNFWRNIDPFDPGGQFCDRGRSYRTAIFYEGDEQKEAALASKASLERQVKLAVPIATEVAPLEAFYAAGAEHQDYYRRNVRQYFSYNAGCGRAERLKQIWGKPDR